MLPDRVSNPGPLTYESAALPIALRGPDVPNVHDVLNTLGCRCTNVHDVWNTLGSRCTNVAGSLGTV